MNIKSFGKYFIKTIGIMLLSLLILSTLYYFNILRTGIVNYLRIFLIIIISFISSYKLGKRIEKNGYLEGAKLGGSICLFFLLISMAFFRDYFKLRVFIYYLIIIITSILGSMIGINKRTN